MDNATDSAQRPATLPVPSGLRTHVIPCAPGHDVVYGLARGAGDEIYLAPSNEFTPGLCAMVFAFNVVTGRFRPVIDVQKATGFDPASGRMPHCKIHLALNATREGRAFACTHFTAPGVGQKDFEPIAAYRHAYDGCHLIEYDPVADRAIHHGRLVPGEGARISCLDETRRQYYFLSYPRNHLYRYDYHQRELHDLGRVGQENAFGLEVDDEGNVYTSDDLGRVVIYSFTRDAIEETDLFLPLAPGRRANGNYIRRMTRAADGCFYGFTNKGVRLFRLDPRERRIDDLGVIHGRERRDASGYPKLPPAKALISTSDDGLLIAFGGDGIYVDDVPVPNLVRYNLATRHAEDLGKFIDGGDGLPAWIPQCAVSMPERGVAYFGLQQTVGRLRLWQIPIAPRPRPSRVVPAELFREHERVVGRQPFGASVEGGNCLPYVRCGHLQMHELGWPGEDRVIPAGETAMGALTFAGDTLYGVTIGRRSHLFSFRPYQRNRFTENYEVHPWDLGVLDDGPIEQAALWLDAPAQRLVICTRGARGFAVFAYAFGVERLNYHGAYHSLPHWPPVSWPRSPFTVLRREDAEAVCSVAYLAGSNRLVWTTATSEVRSVELVADAVARDHSAELRAALVVAIDPRRFAAFGAKQSSVLSITDEGKFLVEQALTLAERGTTFAAVDPSATRIAGGGKAGTVEIVQVGGDAKPVLARLPHPWPVRALAWQGAETIYGFQGQDDAIGEAFAVRASTGEVCSIGILQTPTAPRYWICHQGAAMAAGTRGEVYFGEHDRSAHLFAFVAGEDDLWRASALPHSATT